LPTISPIRIGSLSQFSPLHPPSQLTPLRSRFGPCSSSTDLRPRGKIPRLRPKTTAPPHCNPRVPSKSRARQSKQKLPSAPCLSALDRRRRVRSRQAVGCLWEQE